MITSLQGERIEIQNSHGRFVCEPIGQTMNVGKTRINAKTPTMTIKDAEKVSVILSREIKNAGLSLQSIVNADNQWAYIMHSSPSEGRWLKVSCIEYNSQSNAHEVIESDNKITFSQDSVML